MSLPRLLVFASGSKDGGGSGFEKLVENVLAGVLAANIVGVVSNHLQGGVRQIANRLGVMFFHFLPPPEPLAAAMAYQQLVAETRAEWVALSGWLKLVSGLDPCRTINIHPGPLPEFGGPGMFGHHVHRTVLEAWNQTELRCSAVSMHFVTEPKSKEDYDKGPVFFRFPVIILPGDTAETLAARVNRYEHGWQSWATNLVVSGQIHWSGVETAPVIVPDWYKETPFCPPTCVSQSTASVANRSGYRMVL